ncbi:hypothetical protein CEE45_08180 [Candidatus Heimdallarchaeota archaeon B3_Heim]|nr:MAG: hypothetical protein CEE45_08180 [Candidatus Heimdallarchaeota archaeon B3_Heim]
MKKIIILAMHGAPPNDFPSEEKNEFFRLHSKIEASSLSLSKESLNRYDYLEEKMRTWPRNEKNDPYFYGSLDIAEQLGIVTEKPVIVGFNEFCAPTILEAITQAVHEGATKIFVLTTMLTRGGDHSEKDIPEEVSKARMKFSAVSIRFLWPYNPLSIAHFLSQQIEEISSIEEI